MKHQRIHALLLCLLLLLCVFTACGKKTEDDGKAAQAAETPAAASEAPADAMVYVPNYISLDPEKAGSLSGFAVLDGVVYCAGYGVVGSRTPTQEELTMYPDEDWIYEQWGSTLWKLEADGTLTLLTEYTPLGTSTAAQAVTATTTTVASSDGSIVDMNNTVTDSSINGLVAGPDGTLWVAENLYTYTADESDPYGGESTSAFYLRNLDLNGAELNRVALDCVGDGKTLNYIDKFTVDANGLVYLSDGNQTLCVLDANGTVQFTLEASNWFASLLTLSDGRIAVCSYEGAGAVMKVVDPTAKAWAADAPTLTGNELDANRVYSGSGAYLFYCADSTSLYGCKADGTLDTLVNWLESDISSDYVEAFLPLSDGQLAIYSRDWNTSATYLIQLNLTPASQVPVRQPLTLATIYASSDLRSAVVEFNRTNQEYRINLTDYSQFNTDANPEGGVERLNADILSGQAPDLLEVNSLPVALYAQKGLLEDLTPYIDSDPDLTMDGLMGCYVNAASVDGKLYTVYPSFSFNTVVGLTSNVGTGSGWTWNEINALAAAHPDMPLFSADMTQSQILTILAVFALDDFIDYKTATCSFDSQAFIDILEFAGQFPAEFNYDNYVDEYSTIMNGQQLLCQVGISDLSDVKLYETLFGGEVTFIGFPTSDGSCGSAITSSGSTLAICSQSQNKDAAWSFARMLLDADYQLRLNQWYGFCTNRAAFEEHTKTWMQENTNYDSEGNLQSNGGIGWGDGVMVDVYPPSQEQVDAFETLLDQVNRSFQYDSNVLAILTEEAGAFFAGQRSAQETASVIQGRMAIYISEQS